MESQDRGFDYVKDIIKEKPNKTKSQENQNDITEWHRQIFNDTLILHSILLERECQI